MGEGEGNSIEKINEKGKIKNGNVSLCLSVIRVILG